MKDAILGWLGVTSAPSDENPISVERAAAALMVEIMAVDHHWADEEASHIQSLLQETLALSTEDALSLLAQAKADHQESNDLYRYTSVINTHYSPEQKQALLERLWTVAYVDGQIDRYEEHMLRKLSDLLHLPHSKYIQAKLSAREKMS